MIVLKPEYQSLTEAEVRAALCSVNPVSLEVGRLYGAYIERFRNSPSDVEKAKPRWPIEALAMQRALAYLSAAIEME